MICLERQSQGDRDINKVLTVDSLYGCRAVGRERLGTVLADTLLPVKCHSVAGWEGLSANRKQIEHQRRALTGAVCATNVF